jgi:hypothetical protein
MPNTVRFVVDLLIDLLAARARGASLDAGRSEINGAGPLDRSLGTC